MLSFIKNIFRKPTIKFGTDISNFVTVLDSDNKVKKADELYCGLISKVDFSKRTIEVVTKSSYRNQRYLHILTFDQIVTISRMKDGRLRMWINVED